MSRSRHTSADAPEAGISGCGEHPIYRASFQGGDPRVLQQSPDGAAGENGKPSQGFRSEFRTDEGCWGATTRPAKAASSDSGFLALANSRPSTS